MTEEDYSHQSVIQVVSKRASASSATIAITLRTVAPMPSITTREV